jgi:hypothetical protein
MLRIHLHTMCRFGRNVNQQRNAAITNTCRFALRPRTLAMECEGSSYFFAASAGFTISTSQGTSTSEPPHGGKVRFVKAFSTQLPTALPW